MNLAIEKGSKILIIIEKDSEIPLDFHGLEVIQRPALTKLPGEELTNALRQFFKEFSKEFEEKLYNEPFKIIDIT